MRIERLRDLPDMAATYTEPHDHALYGHGHHVRIEMTKAVAKWHARDCCTGADLSCGNGAVGKHLEVQLGVRFTYGDYAPGWEFAGPMEDTLEQIGSVDLFSCNETLEHLDDPEEVLCQIRGKARKMILSTPIDCWHDTNGEHLWAWDREGVEAIMSMAGWDVDAFASFDSRPLGEPYNYGIWAVS